MASFPFPSIQSFYQREVAANHDAVHQGRQDACDGLTENEVSAGLRPLSQPWKPTREYRKCPIASLEAGPHNYEITGRVVNFYTPAARTQNQSSTESQYLILLSDDSGVFAVSVPSGALLFYLKPCDFNLIFGQRITIYTTYIAHPTKAETGYISYVNHCSTIYLGRNGATHIIFHRDLPLSDGDYAYRYQLGLHQQHDGGHTDLMSLKSFLSSGFDMGEGKILVCVRSVGPRKTIQPRRREGPLDLVEVGICDETATSVLKLWGDHVPTSKSFVPNHTILLISHPICKTAGQQVGKSQSSTEVSIGYSSMVHLNPIFAEAAWLRKKITDISKKESVLVSFPCEVWDNEVSLNHAARELFTISEVDENVRQDTKRDFVGKLNIVILEMHLTAILRKGMLCCTECCNIPLYANKPLAMCKNCGSQRELSLNPRVLGALIDESGTLTAAKLAWKDTVWTQLFFAEVQNAQDIDTDGFPNLVEQSWEDLTALDTITLKDIEEQMIYSRVTLTFGWCSRMERLCILAAEW
ncbi:hypothetical protein SUNI508_12522 [Seiridium unicorne]|uniref:Uncharacterized protein n=1 Tax=Seiridium unicorne TaxID=138068 RepID=A0ABR2VI37_9PEZI